MKALTVLVLTVAASCRTAANEVAGRVRLIAKEAEPREVSVAYEDLSSGDHTFVNADVIMHAASTMKIAVMIEVFRESESGTLPLDTPIRIENRFNSVVDGSEFTLDATDDGDAELYTHAGQELTVRELVRRMITRSSNLATDLLIERVTPSAVQRTIESLGMQRTKVVRGVEDQKAFDAGIVNVTTARDLLILLRSIALGGAASPRSCGEMIEMLLAQEFNSMIPAGLPRGTRVAHKTGDITRIRHDAAIVYGDGDRPYVLVVMTRGFDNPKEADEVGARISRIAWDAQRSR